MHSHSSSQDELCDSSVESEGYAFAEARAREDGHLAFTPSKTLHAPCSNRHKKLRRRYLVHSESSQALKERSGYFARVGAASHIASFENATYTKCQQKNEEDHGLRTIRELNMNSTRSVSQPEHPQLPPSDLEQRRSPHQTIPTSDTQARSRSTTPDRDQEHDFLVRLSTRETPFLNQAHITPSPAAGHQCYDGRQGEVHEPGLIPQRDHGCVGQSVSSNLPTNDWNSADARERLEGQYGQDVGSKRQSNDARRPECEGGNLKREMEYDCSDRQITTDYRRYRREQEMDRRRHAREQEMDRRRHDREQEMDRRRHEREQEMGRYRHEREQEMDCHRHRREQEIDRCQRKHGRVAYCRCSHLQAGMQHRESGIHRRKERELEVRRECVPYGPYPDASTLEAAYGLLQLANSSSDLS
ncbi:unnamed protein product [Peniophora sp. CBMAI 1063]|nr:unnamed protein product [Peniophora sp. CBMAI 1063]